MFSCFSHYVCASVSSPVFVIFFIFFALAIFAIILLSKRGAVALSIVLLLLCRRICLFVFGAPSWCH